MIISLSGKKLSGKSTVAKILEAKGFERLSFAGPLKQIVSEAFNLPMFLLTDQVAKEKCELSINLDKVAVMDLCRIAGAKFYPITAKQFFNAINNPCNTLCMTPRQLLQVVGTEVFRETVAQDYWLNAFKSQIKAGKNYICDDARFSNEQALVKELGGYTIGIERPGIASSDTHASEQIDLSNCDFILKNLYTIKELQYDVETTYMLIKELDCQNPKSAVK
jgi:hypothetical protein